MSETDAFLQDELFHIAVFDWMMQSELSDRLLSVKSGFLENYLLQTVKSTPDNILAADMLWKYYEQVQNRLIDQFSRFSRSNSTDQQRER
jgi:nuclear pore complex protein Nup155